MTCLGISLITVDWTGNWGNDRVTLPLKTYRLGKIVNKNL